jgi:ABC-2 type transport system permease protein
VTAAVGATLLILVFGAAMAVTGGEVLGGTSTLLADLAGAALVQLPAIGVLGGMVVSMMSVPRWSVGLSWALVVCSIFIGPMFGPSLGFPTWLLNMSPFTHVPNAPAVAVSLGPVLTLGAAGALLAVAAVTLLRRRNLALPA